MVLDLVTVLAIPYYNIPSPVSAPLLKLLPDLLGSLGGVHSSSELSSSPKSVIVMEVMHGRSERWRAMWGDRKIHT